MAIGTILSELPVSRIHQDWIFQRGTFAAQPQMTAVFLEQQARQIADALLKPSRQIRFELPDRITVPASSETLVIPAASRTQTIGGRFGRPSSEQARQALVHVLDTLERDPDPAFSLAGSAVRYAVASTMIYQMLPDGRPVNYVLAEGDEIPSLPTEQALHRRSALTAATDALVEGEADRDGQVQVPFAPFARRFFLPQWVAFDEEDQLLVNQVAEAESYLASMQQYMQILGHAVAIAPYIVADEAYQRKRAGMLGQLINQGRALARFHTARIIMTIRRRAAENTLNRGLTVRIPYFDDRQLALHRYMMTVVPDGRIVFVPAFVVRAVRLEAAQVAQSTDLNPSTRRHLLAEFAMLETAFIRQSPTN